MATQMAGKPSKRKVPKSRRDRDKSVVRFKRNVSSPSASRGRAPPPSPHHLYVPRLHRQQTEKEMLSSLGVALAAFTQKGLGPELDAHRRVSAQLEVSGILDQTYQSLSRNLFGLDFQEPIFVANGFAHWQIEPEKRIVCHLPLRLLRVKSHPQSFGTAFIHLPRSFAPHKNLDHLDLQSADFEQKRYLSIKKFYVLVLKLLGRALLAKGVPQDMLHFSSTQRLLEISLKESKGWVAEIVPCIAVGRIGDYYCCKPFKTTPARKTAKYGSESEAESFSGSDKENSSRALVNDEMKIPGRNVVLEEPVSNSVVTQSRVDKGLSVHLPRLSLDTSGQTPRGSDNRTGHQSKLSYDTEEHLPKLQQGQNITTSLVNAEERRKSNRSVDFLVNPQDVTSDHKSPSAMSADDETESEWEAKGKRDILMKVKVAASDRSDYSASDAREDLLDTDDDTHKRNSSRDDSTWYRCSPSSENQLLHSISMTDSGVRVSAMYAVCRLCQKDWRLQLITAYTVQTAMLHEADDQMDATPRWQRNSLEHCTKSILKKLHHFTKIQRLPHFFVQGVNLWDGVALGKLSLARSALERLTTSDIALTSLVCRAGEISLPSDVHLYSSLLPQKQSNSSTADREEGWDLNTCNPTVSNYFKISKRPSDLITHPGTVEGLGSKILSKDSLEEQTTKGILKSSGNENAHKPEIISQVADASFADVSTLSDPRIASQHSMTGSREGQYRPQTDCPSLHRGTSRKPTIWSHKQGE